MAIAHLTEILKSHKTWLTNDAQVLAIVPNVQHWYRIINLFKGEWENSEFTRYWLSLSSLKSSFTTAGLQIYEIQTCSEKGKEFQKFIQLTEPLVNA